MKFIENIIVNHVSPEKLSAFLNIKLESNQKLLIEKFAVWSSTLGISTDSCFWHIMDRHQDNNTIVKCVDIECRIQKFTSENGYSLRMDKPDFIKTITLDDYLKLSTPLKLIDFIRYNYNPRIISNQKLLLNHIKDFQND